MAVTNVTGEIIYTYREQIDYVSADGAIDGWRARARAPTRPLICLAPGLRGG